MSDNRKRRHSPLTSPRKRHRDRDSDRSRDKDSDRSRDKDMERSRDKDSDRSRDKDSDRSRDRHSDRHRRSEDDRHRHDRSLSRSETHEKKARKFDEEDIFGGIQNHNKSKEKITSDLKAKEVIYQARMSINDRMQKFNMPDSSITTSQYKKASTLKPEEASVFVDFQMSKLNKLNDLKHRLTKNLTNIGNLVKTPALVLDNLEEQAIIKHENNIKQEPGFTTPMPSTKPTQIKKKEPDIIEYLDPRLSVKSAQRSRRPTFEFKAQGEFEKLANVQRSKAKLDKLQSEISRVAKHTGISSAVKLAIVTPSGMEMNDAYIPKIEWWDEIVLGKDKGYDDIPSKDLNPQLRYQDSITVLVEHPIQLKSPDEPLQPQYIKACLTQKERKKLRRQNRREVQKEKAEKIRLGLEKPPEPKLKISNLMRVLGSDAVQDPTKMEAHVRKQIQERQNKHVLDNAQRQLTREEKTAKSIRKMAEDVSLSVNVAVYKIKSLSNLKTRFKVQTNAKQCQMTGIILLLDDINVVIVEGGPKQQKFYKNLMLNRIKWAEEIAGEKKVRKRDQEHQEGERNECDLIWEGIVKKRAFNAEPRFITATSHKNAREILDKHGVAHYWDLCYSTRILLSNDE